MDRKTVGLGIDVGRDWFVTCPNIQWEQTGGKLLLETNRHTVAGGSRGFEVTKGPSDKDRTAGRPGRDENLENWGGATKGCDGKSGLEMREDTGRLQKKQKPQIIATVKAVTAKAKQFEKGKKTCVKCSNGFEEATQHLSRVASIEQVLLPGWCCTTPTPPLP